MSSPSTKETLTVLDKAEYLGTTIRAQKHGTSSALGDIFGVLPPRDGAEEPRHFDWDLAQDDNIDLIDDGIRGAREASKDHRGMKILVSTRTSNRSQKGKVLRSHHRSLQKILKGSCGEESLKYVGLDVPPVGSLFGVREQYGLIHKQMRNPALPGKLAELAETVGGGSVPDIAGILTVMEANIQAFEGAQVSLNEAKKRRDQAYAAKKAAQKRLRNIVVNVARVQEGYYRLAGLGDLADRMRLTIPKSKKASPDDPTDTSEPTPDAGTPPSASAGA